MITTILTVMRVVPAKADAAPMTAYVPGVTQGISGSQELNARKEGYSRCQTSTTSPTTRP